MPDPKTEELQLAEIQRELADRQRARESDQAREEESAERRADKHAYLREKLAERAQSEDEVASEEQDG
jgi:hypothetical protein